MKKNFPVTQNQVDYARALILTSATNPKGVITMLTRIFRPSAVSAKRNYSARAITSFAIPTCRLRPLPIYGKR